MAQPIQLEFTYELRDWQEASRNNLLRQWRKVGDESPWLLLLLFLAGFSVWAKPHAAMTYFTWGILFLFLAGYSLPLLAHWLLSRRLFKQYISSPFLKHPFKVKIDQDGLATDCEIASDTRTLESATGYSESETVVIIKYGESSSFWIPKRVMQPAQIDELRALLQSKLGPASQPGVATLL